MIKDEDKPELDNLLRNFINAFNIPKDINFFILGGSAGCSVLCINDNKDIDVYFHTENDFTNMMNHFINKYEELNNHITSHNAYTISTFITGYSKDIQLIRRKFSSEAQEFFDNFDMNKSCIGIDNSGNYYEDDFYSPLYIKRYHYDTLNRLYKYGLRFDDMSCFQITLDKFLNNDGSQEIEIQECYGETCMNISNDDVVINFVNKTNNIDFDKYFKVNIKTVELLKSVCFSEESVNLYELPAIITILNNSKRLLLPPFYRTNVSSERMSYITHLYPEWFL